MADDERDLPQEMVESVQQFLPVKSLIRFKCVCKSWYSLVSDPYFINIHSHHFSQSPETSSAESHLIKYPTFDNMLALAPPNDPIYIFLDSCNGLVALFYMADSFSTQEIVLWNPATKLSKSIPHSNAAFGPAKRVSLGFGCDANGDFKVVRIFCLKTKEMRAEVYSSKADSWTTIEVGGFDEFIVKYITHKVIVSGNPYWIAYTDERKETTDDDYDDGHVLFGFDATNMEFKIMPLQQGWNEMLMVDWEGSLAMLMCVKKGYDWLESIDVWMYNDEKKWTRNLRFGAVLELQVDECLACSRSGKILVGGTDGRVFIYDSKKNSVAVRELKKDGVDYPFSIVAYDETLAYVEGMTPAVVSENDEELDGAFNAIQGFLVYTMNKRGEIACYYRLAF